MTHRVAIVLGGDPLAPDPWPVAATPRASAEPHLDRWVGSLLGDPTTVRCRLTFRDAANQPADLTISLAQLALRPLDLLALAARLDAGATVTELDTRIVALAPESATEIEIVYAADPASDRQVIRTFPDALELARGINALLGSSRALEPKDLLPPDEVQAADSADRLTFEATARASVAESSLNQATSQVEAALQVTPLDVSSLRNALRGASLFVAGAFPPARSSVESLAAKAGAVLDELRGRRTTAAAASDPLETVRAIFGRDFVFLPTIPQRECR